MNILMYHFTGGEVFQCHNLDVLDVFELLILPIMYLKQIIIHKILFNAYNMLLGCTRLTNETYLCMAL